MLVKFHKSFYSEVQADLRKENCFVDLNHKEAFDLLYKEAWRPEEAAMGNSTLPTILDKLCMVANINSRKLIEITKGEIKLKDTKIQELTQRIDSLQQKIDDQGRRLDILSSKLIIMEKKFVKTEQMETEWKGVSAHPVQV